MHPLATNTSESLMRHPATPISSPQSFPFRHENALMLIALLYSGNPAFGRVFPLEPQLSMLAIFFAILILRTRRTLLSMDFAAIASIFAAISLVQCIDFSHYPIITISGFFIRLFIGYALVRTVSSFTKTYIHILVVLSKLSFFFYFPQILLNMLKIDVAQFAAQISHSMGTTIESASGYGITYYPLFIHTFNSMQPALRNSGMFWEPGAFQGYLILALIFLGFHKRHISKTKYLRSLFILCVAVITTLSTTGFIALSLVPLLHYNWLKKAPRKALLQTLLAIYLLLPILAGIGIFAYKNIPFLGEKLSKEFESVGLQDNAWHRSRIGSLVLNWNYIKKRPFTGWGLSEKTRFSLNPEMIGKPQGMGNGFADFIAKFGLIGFLAWFTPIYFVFKRLSLGNLGVAFLSSLILLIELQGEAFLAFPLFLGLPFLYKNIPSLTNKSFRIPRS